MNVSQMCDSEALVEQLIRQYDETTMPLPDLECEPQLLISKVRKHYMEYLIRLLSENYETNQQLINKNIYLPSAIWRCAKEIETAAAQTCMVVQLYRKHIVTAIKEVTHDTKKKKLNKKLYECLHTPPKNEKKTQTTVTLPRECTCECTCKQKKKRRRQLQSPKISQTLDNAEQEINKIPVLINSQVEEAVTNNNFSTLPSLTNPGLENNCVVPSSSVRMSIESQESDDLMMQLEKLFQSDPNDANDDDLFDLYFNDTNCESMKKIHNENTNGSDQSVSAVDNSTVEPQTNQSKSLDERLVSLAGLLTTNTAVKPDETKVTTIETPRQRKSSSKWLCEEHFLKSRFYELLDEIGDHNRKRLIEIKHILTELFGEDSDNEGVVSPLEETPEFVISCKERIAPWVVKLLTPHYIRGHIIGKALFKALAKHLIRLIYQCSRYPQEYEVKSFVSDFMKTHKLIRCEADFKQFRIENI